MSLTSGIARQIVVSSVLLSIFQWSSAVRFSRSMRYPAPSMRKYMNPWKYFQYSQLPRGMQRRFMWKEMDDTVDELMDGVASGARVINQMFTPTMMRFRTPIEYEPQASTKVKYVIKKPAPAFKRIKVMKYHNPQKTIPIYHPPLAEIPQQHSHHPPQQQNIIVPFMSEGELRKLEKEQEKRVEREHNHGIHEHSHQNHMDNDVVGGRIPEFGEDWLPIQGPLSTPKSYPVSQLHTHIQSVTTVAPSPLPVNKNEVKETSYQVTEHSAEESVRREHSFKPPTHFEFFGPSTEVPNYPEHFLKSIQHSEPKRLRLQLTTTYPTASSVSSFTLSNRLPPKSTTERPFKRYNLHRPKSSKLFFNRPTSSPESTKQIFTATTTEEVVRSASELLPVIEEEPVKTTLPTIKTTREPIRTTKETLKKPPERKRSPRNDSEVKSKIRIKNSTQNEELKKVLNKNRGSVKFGEKLS